MHSVIYFSFCLILLLIGIVYIELINNDRKNYSKTGIDCSIILIVILWHLFELYHTNKSLKRTNHLAQANINDIGKE